MKTEKITRNEATKTRANSSIIHLTADEGMKLINQDYLDEVVEEPNICSEVYVASEGSPLDWAEITQEEADRIQKEWDEKATAEMAASMPSDTPSSGEEATDE